MGTETGSHQTASATTQSVISQIFRDWWERPATGGSRAALIHELSTTARAPLCHWTRTRRCQAPRRGPDALSAVRSRADCTINMPGL